MNDVESNSVRHALTLVGKECSRAIEAFRSPEQLHQFALNYNPNDGCLPLLALVHHPICDAGTASYIYWQFTDLLFDPQSRESCRLKVADWNDAVVLDAIEQRFLEGDFATAEIYYNPQEDWTLNSIQRSKLLLAGVDQERLQPIGLRKLEREWLLT